MTETTRQAWFALVAPPTWSTYAAQDVQVSSLQRRPLPQDRPRNGVAHRRASAARSAARFRPELLSHMRHELSRVATERHRI